jgi:ABC-2 type transport system ATP-binding protein
MNNLLEINGLSKSYGAFALENVSFAIPKGYIMGFVGPNGAGKTTTIKAILKISRFQAGSVKLFGAELGAEPGAGVGAGTGAEPGAGAPSQNERLGVVMDTPFYVDEWTVCDVETALAPFYPHWDSGIYHASLRRFGIDGRKKIKELSRGMKVKAQIAAALCHEAELLILDEPTSGLDPAARDEICDILRDFVTDENRGVLFSTHITADLEKTADYITFIMDGRIVFTGAKEELLEKYTRVAGGLDEISPAQKKLVVGYREHGTGFEGMIETAQIRAMPETLLTEPITLDEIIIFRNREGKLHE